MSRTGKPPINGMLESGVEDMSLENGISPGQVGAARSDVKIKSASSNISTPKDPLEKRKSQSPLKNGHASAHSTPDDTGHEVVGGEVTVSIEPGKPPKLSRSTSQKVKSRPPRLFRDAEDALPQAQRHFDRISSCNYANRYIGSTEHGSMDCDCVEEWDGVAKVNAACGADSDCINRATKMECMGDCGCGADCQNQRFQQKQYAPITVIDTDKKGFGLRTDADLDPDDFIYEYIGEVIGEAQFRKRMIQYDEQGIIHFYFMSLTQGEFIDATKKGNLGRFCNHSCNPNCYVDKWVVGDKLRMGIFAERKIQAGEELTFNYNVDRYGADPQPCYCGEPNCTGLIGGKSQTERATKLSHTTIEALGIDDGDGWDTAVAKKPRKKKAGEDDEEYVNNVQPKELDENGVTKVMATLMQSKEKWISVKLLDRIQRSPDEKIRNRVVKMHGYQILNSNLALWKDDANVVLQIFDILDSFPRLTKNKIADSKIEMTVEGLKGSIDERVALKANHLLQEWAHLDMAYRIPRKKREIDTSAAPEKLNHFARRSSRDERKTRSRSRSAEEQREIPKGPSAPSGPRNNFPQRQPGFFQGPRPPYRPRVFNELPNGWFTATDDGGRTYFYDVTGKTTWQRPTAAASSQPPPPPPKPTGTNKALEDIINEITNAKANAPKEKLPPSVGNSSQNGGSDAQKIAGSSGKEKWRNLSQEKQMRLYENTLFPHVKYVMDKFKGKLPKEDLKRFAKEISKKLVSSDFKNGRVEDPTKISSKKERQVKTYVKEFFDKAAQKHKEREKRRVLKKTQPIEDGQPEKAALHTVASKEEIASDGDEDMALSDEEGNKGVNVELHTPPTPMETTPAMEGLKRKREDAEEGDGGNLVDPTTTPSKYVRSGTPPPPPPPPPITMNGFLDSPLNGSEGAPETWSPGMLPVTTDQSKLPQSVSPGQSGPSDPVLETPGDPEHEKDVDG